MKQLDALKTLKDQRIVGRAMGFVDLFGNGLPRLAQTGAQSELNWAVHREAEYREETQRYNPLWFLHKDGGGQKQRIFEKAKATLHATLVFVDANKALVGKGRRLQGMGACNPARFVQNFHSSGVRSVLQELGKEKKHNKPLKRLISLDLQNSSMNYSHS